MMNKEEFLKLFNECVKNGDISFETEEYGNIGDKSIILYLKVKVDGISEKHQIAYFEK